MHARAFPGSISVRKVSLGEPLAYTDPGPAVEEGANADPGRAAERCRNAGPVPGAALEAKYATGTAADGFARMKEPTAEPAVAAEGDVWAGASTEEQMHTLPGAWRCRAIPHPLLLCVSFTHANPSTAVLIAYFASSAATRPAFLLVSAALPGSTFAPSSAAGLLGSVYVRSSPRGTFRA